MRRFYLHVVLIFLLATTSFVGCSEQEELFDVHTGMHHPASTAGAVDAAGAETRALIAGQRMDAGTVTCSVDGNMLYVEYATSGGWMLFETHLAVAGSMEGIPVNPSGNPTPGHFPLKAKHAPAVSSFEYSVDLSAQGLADAEMLYVAAHAAVKRFDGGTLIDEQSAWCKGDRFPPVVSNGKVTRKGNWAMYFTLNVHELRDLSLWNKLGSDGEVGNSEVGPDGNEVGTITYAPAKFGNGFKPNTDRSAIEFPNSVLSRNNGCVEMWVKPEFDKTLGGRLCWLLNQRTTGYSVPSDQWMISASYVNYQLGLWMYIGGGMTETVYLYWEPDWAIGDLVHLAFAWDINAENGFTLAIFRNGEMVASTDAPIYGSGTQPGSTLWIGNVHYDYTAYTNWVGYIDNVKVWRYSKTDFSDRFEE